MMDGKKMARGSSIFEPVHSSRQISRGRRDHGGCEEMLVIGKTGGHVSGEKNSTAEISNGLVA